MDRSSCDTKLYASIKQGSWRFQFILMPPRLSRITKILESFNFENKASNMFCQHCTRIYLALFFCNQLWVYNCLNELIILLLYYNNNIIDVLFDGTGYLFRDAIPTIRLFTGEIVIIIYDSHWISSPVFSRSLFAWLNLPTLLRNIS